MIQEELKDKSLIPVWEIELALGNRSYSFLTTETQHQDYYDELEPVGYLMITKKEPENDTRTN